MTMSVEQKIDALDKYLQGYHDGKHDIALQGSCWCCCIPCTENEGDDREDGDFIQYLQEEYWRYVDQYNREQGNYTKRT